VLTTHYMEEAYELCDEIAIMDRGRIIAQGSPDQLLRQHFQGLSIRIAKGALKLSDFSRLRAEVFERPDAFEVLTSEPDSTMRSLLDLGIPLEGIQVRTKNLEDLFLKLTGRGIEQGQDDGREREPRP
jgi:ABC-2 type transport system ATP-binding protein